MAASMAMPLSIERKFVHNNALSSHSAARYNSFHSTSLKTKLHFQSQGIFSRRLLLVTAASSWDALASVFSGASKAREASLAVKRGMQLFVQGDVEKSLTEFDKAIELDPRQRLYLWQRGLSLYYLNRYEEGAKQFRDDVAANPNDTEESIWCFLCEAQLYGVDEARRRFLEVGPDPRPVMKKTYEMFKNGGNPDELTAQFSNVGEQECFYAALYASLYHEAQNDLVAAKEAMIVACLSPYGLRSTTKGGGSIGREGIGHKHQPIIELSVLVIIWLHLPKCIVNVEVGMLKVCQWHRGYMMSENLINSAFYSPLLFSQPFGFIIFDA